jgi:D-inositol-3-phosphate glycosyltransferase
MRICSPQLGLSPSATLGGEVYDREILTGLSRLGAEVQVLLPQNRPAPVVPNLSVTRLPLRRGYRWWVSNLVFVPYIGREYRRCRFDVLRVHSLRFTGLAALWARRLYSLPVPIVAHHHHIDDDSWTELVDLRVARAVDLVLTGSRFAADDLLARLAPKQCRVEPVYYGAADQYRPRAPSERLRACLGLDGVPAVLYVGSLKPRKNLPLLLDAFGEVLEARGGQARLLVVGTGPEEAALRSLARRLGLEHAVVLCGAVSEEEKHEYYSIASVFVTASSMEGFGLAVAEAMACGLPVVATRVGSLPEVVVDGTTGFLVDPGNPGQLADRLAALLRDEALARRLGEAGRRRVEQCFRWEKAAQSVLDLYREAARDFGGGAGR